MTKQLCPFRQPDETTWQPTSYCQRGDCPYDLGDEEGCKLFTTHRMIIEQAKKDYRFKIAGTIRKFHELMDEV